VKKIFLPSIFLFLIITTILCGCKKNQDNYTIFCAAGLSEYIKEVKELLDTRENKILLNIGSSGTLARQIEYGNKADIFISANWKWANYIDSLGFADTVIPFCKNKLVLVSPRNSKHYSFNESLFNATRISCGNPKYVPAGQYAKEILDKMELYDTLENKLIFTKDVKSALRLVELNECQAGFVYYSDAVSSKKVSVVQVFDEELHKPVIFYLVRLKNHKKDSPFIYNRLISTEFSQILQNYGLTPLSPVWF